MLKANSKAVLDIVATQKKRNAAQAYREIHPKASDITARVNAYQLMNKPEAQVYLQEHVAKAVNRIVELVDSDKPDIALRASQDIIDREKGRAIQKTELTSTGVTLTIDLTSALTTE
jgi:DNA phosphorothioation-dependent restriction protein DptG